MAQPSLEQIFRVAMQDPIQASELASQLIDPAFGFAKEILDKYGEDVGEYIKQFNKFSTQLDIETMNQYIEGGFDREEALRLMIVRKQTAKNMLDVNRK